MRLSWAWEWYNGSRRFPGPMQGDERTTGGKRHLGLRLRDFREKATYPEGLLWTPWTAAGSRRVRRLHPNRERAPHLCTTWTSAEVSQGCVSIRGPSSLGEDVQALPCSQTPALPPTLGRRRGWETVLRRCMYFEST